MVRLEHTQQIEHEPLCRMEYLRYYFIYTYLTIFSLLYCEMREIVYREERKMAV